MEDTKPSMSNTIATPSTTSSSEEKETKDPNLVPWDGPEDPEPAKNWWNETKWNYTLTVAVFTMMAPIGSSMVSPALSQLKTDLHFTSQVETELTLTIFVLAYIIGPSIFGSTSELYGRIRLLQFSNLWFLVFNLNCGWREHLCNCSSFASWLV